MAKKKQLTLEEKLQEALIPIEEHPYEIPDNWEWVRLDACKANKNYSFVDGPFGSNLKTTDYTENGVRIIQLQNIKEGSWDDKNRKYISSQKAEELFKHKAYPGDVAIAKMASPIARATLVPNFEDFYIIVADCVKLSVSELISNKFIEFGINSPEIRKQADKLGKGTTRRRINLGDLKKLKCPLPPIPEQKRIVAKLEFLLSKTREAREKIEEAKETFELRRSSILHRAFTGELTAKWREENQQLVKIDSPYKKVKLSELIDGKCQNGIYKPKTAYGEGTAIIRIDSFYNGVIKPINFLKKLKLSKEEINLYKLSKNDIVINRVNSIQYLGKSGLFENDKEDCVFESNIMKISINNLIIPKFLIYYLNSNEGLNELRKHAKHAVNQASINQTDVKNVLAPLPSVPEQKEIVRIIEDMLEAEEKSKDLLDMGEQIDLIEKSILSKAFRGELGTNDASDEPAIELLKRVIEEE